MRTRVSSPSIDTAPFRALQLALTALLRRVFTAQASSTRRFSDAVAPTVSVDPSRDRRAVSRALLARRSQEQMDQASTRLPLERVVHSDPDIQGGTPVFVETRVPVQNLLDYLEGGYRYRAIGQIAIR